MIDAQIVEYFASAVHDVWMNWSQAVSVSVSKNRLKRWQKLWVPYWDLPAEEKKSDRKITRELLEKVYPLIRNKVKRECWWCDAPLGNDHLLHGGFCSMACRQKCLRIMFKEELKRARKGEPLWRRKRK